MFSPHAALADIVVAQTQRPTSLCCACNATPAYLMWGLWQVYPGVHIDTTQVVAALAPATPRVASKPSASLPFDLSSQRLEATSSGKLAGSSFAGPLPATTPVGDTKDVAAGEPGTASTASTGGAGVVPAKEQSASTAAPATGPASANPAESEPGPGVGGAAGGDGASRPGVAGPESA